MHESGPAVLQRRACDGSASVCVACCAEESNRELVAVEVQSPAVGRMLGSCARANLLIGIARISCNSCLDSDVTRDNHGSEGQGSAIRR